MRAVACLLALLLVSLPALALVAAQQQQPAEPAEPPKPKAPTVLSDAAFERADADHNGQLDAREFAAFTASIRQALEPFLGVNYGDGDGGNNELLRRADGPRPAAGARLRAGGVNKFWSGFVSGILTIWATEIGDKTFFIAAILSMKQDRVVVFAGAIGALVVMTVLSVVMGVVATKFLPPQVTHYLGAILVRAFVPTVSMCGCLFIIFVLVTRRSSWASDSRCSTTRGRCPPRTSALSTTGGGGGGAN